MQPGEFGLWAGCHSFLFSITYRTPDPVVTRLNGSGRKLVFACLRIAFRIRPEKRQTTLHHRRNTQNSFTETLDPSLGGKNDATFA
jgi:hypothetical protein